MAPVKGCSLLMFPQNMPIFWPTHRMCYIAYNMEVADVRAVTSGASSKCITNAVMPLQVWLPTDKNMAGCDNCSFWVHDHCDPLASVALHAPSDIPFYCTPCKRQAEAHAKLTALRQAEAQLRAAQPRRPRSAYHLFSMELNKCGFTAPILMFVVLCL